MSEFNMPMGAPSNDPYFLDESEPEDEKEDYCPMCNELAFVEGHCCACDYDTGHEFAPQENDAQALFGCASCGKLIEADCHN